MAEMKNSGEILEKYLTTVLYNKNIYIMKIKIELMTNFNNEYIVSPWTYINKLKHNAKIAMGANNII